MARLSISQAAKAAGLTPKTLRLWERRGKIPRLRRDRRGARIYSEDDVQRIIALRDTETPGAAWPPVQIPVRIQKTHRKP